MNEEKNIETYALSLIDIMGQKNELVKLNTLSMPTDQDVINTIFNKTYGSIKRFRGHMEGAIKWLNDIKKDEQKSQFNSNEMIVNSFSDLVTSYVSLRDDVNKTQFEGIYFLLFGNGLVFLQMLSGKTPLRGGIDVGMGIKHSNDEIYGSALSNAYYLESNIAKSLRLVIGQSLYNFIEKTNQEKIISNGSLDYNIYWAQECMKIIKQDSDGQYIVDFLSSKFQKLQSFQYHYNEAKKFIESQVLKFGKLHQEYELQKYKKTLRYFESYSLYEPSING